MDIANLELAQKILPIETLNTVYMVIISTILALVIGGPLGVILMLTDKNQLKEHPFIYSVLGTVVNIGRSIPFAILIISMIPLTRWIIGTSLGTGASIIPLTLAAVPFVARLVEMNLKDVDKKTLEAAVVMGSNPWQIVFKVLIPEALPSLITTLSLTIINLIGYSAMAGMVGGGGLGQIAIQYGYHRFNPFIMYLTVAILVIFVQMVQWVGNSFHQFFLKKRGQHESI